MRATITSALLLASVLTLSVIPVSKGQERPTIDSSSFEKGAVLKADWKNVGLNKPSDTLMTFMWAMKEGNMDVLLECYDPKIITQPAYSSDSFKQELKAGADKATSLQIVAVNEIDSDYIAVIFLVGGWHDKPLAHKFRRINDQWKIDGECTTEAAP